MTEFFREPGLWWMYGLAALVGLAGRWLERRFFGHRLVGGLIVAAIIGGVVLSKLSPFTFQGGDYFFEGVIAGLVGAVALGGYLVGQLVDWAVVRRGL